MSKEEENDPYLSDSIFEEDREPIKPPPPPPPPPPKRPFRKPRNPIRRYKPYHPKQRREFPIDTLENGMTVFITSKDEMYQNDIDGFYNIKNINKRGGRLWVCKGSLERKMFFNNKGFCMVLEYKEDSSGRSTWDERNQRYKWLNVGVDIWKRL